MTCLELSAVAGCKSCTLQENDVGRLEIFILKYNVTIAVDQCSCG